MGQEAACEVRFGGKVAAGKALLETDELIFRGDLRLKIPLHAIHSLETGEGILTITWPEGTAAFKLGAHAEKWAHKIRNPRTLADKLDVKPGMRVCACGINDAGFREQLHARTMEIAETKPANETALIFLGAEKPQDLSRIKSLPPFLKPDGGIWIVYPKGRQDMTENDVRAAGLQAGLVDIKVARFSQSHTALKFVIPKANRKRVR